MKYFTLISVILAMVNCDSGVTHNSKLSDKEWNNILDNTLPLLTGERIIYNKYNRLICHDSITSLISYVIDELGYEMNIPCNNSKNENVITWGNIDSTFNVTLMSDSTLLISNYAQYSEPIFLADSFFCILMSNTLIKPQLKRHWLFFFRRRVNEFEMFIYYDFRKHRFYQIAAIPQ